MSPAGPSLPAGSAHTHTPPGPLTKPRSCPHRQDLMPSVGSKAKEEQSGHCPGTHTRVLTAAGVQGRLQGASHRAGMVLCCSLKA